MQKSELRKLRLNAGRMAKRFPGVPEVKSHTDMIRNHVRVIRRDPSELPRIAPYMLQASAATRSSQDS